MERVIPVLMAQNSNCLLKKAKGLKEGVKALEI